MDAGDSIILDGRDPGGWPRADYGNLDHDLGADGVHSVIRGAMTAPSPAAYSGLCAFRALIPAPDAPAFAGGPPDRRLSTVRLAASRWRWRALYTAIEGVHHSAAGNYAPSQALTWVVPENRAGRR